MYQKKEELSNWVQRFASLLPVKGHVLDLAAGGGRHGGAAGTDADPVGEHGDGADDLGRVDGACPGGALGAAGDGDGAVRAGGGGGGAGNVSQQAYNRRSWH